MIVLAVVAACQWFKLSRLSSVFLNLLENYNPFFVFFLFPPARQQAQPVDRNGRLQCRRKKQLWSKTPKLGDGCSLGIGGNIGNSRDTVDNCSDSVGGAYVSNVAKGISAY